MQVDIKLVEAFAMIMRVGSLTKAEAQSGISKSTLSRQLQRLEEQLGVQLLVRSARRVIPTDAGRAFNSHCEALLSEVTARIEAASVEIQEMNSGVKGKLIILSDSQFSTTFVSHVTRVFLRRHPNLECELYMAGRSDSPSVDEVDCYVCERALDLPNLIAKPVGKLSHGLYASPIYLRKFGAPESPEELAGHAAIRMRGTTHSLVHCNGGSRPYLARPVVHTNDYWLMKTFCVDGLGIALMPDFFARPEVVMGNLIPLLPDWKPEPQPVFCAFQRQRYMGKKLRAFIDLVSKSVEDIDSFNTWVVSPYMERT